MRTPVSLKKYNTLHIDVRAAHMTEVRQDSDLPPLVERLHIYPKPIMILGGGSNLLFTGDFEGSMIRMATRGRTLLGSNSHQVFIKVAAGENWDDFVGWTVNQGYGGLENLSLIPGSVGAAPIQNIGAYGKEISEHIMHVEAIDLEKGDEVFLAAEDCAFGYRSSIFKEQFRNKLLITHVVFALDLLPEFRLSYGNLKEEVLKLGGPGIEEVRQAVVNIRNSKLPDPEVLGNAGSFFKNPVLPKEKVATLKDKHPDLPVYPVSEKEEKVAAGWLIDKLGWKGKRRGDAAVHDRQALILVNHGHASGYEILALAEEIRSSVQEAYNICLEFEVNVIE